MSKGNREVAHDFFYEGVGNGECHHYSGCHIHYDGDECRSYATIVAKVIPTVGHDRANPHEPESGMTLVSYESMSHTTAKHLSYIRSASPFDVVHVPMKYGSGWIDERILPKRFIDELAVHARYLNRADHRRSFVELMESRKSIIANAVAKWAEPLKSPDFAEFEAIMADLDGYVKALKAKKRSESAKKAASVRKALDSALGKERTSAEYVAFLRETFTGPAMADSVNYALRNALSGNGDAYVWIEGENLVTSKGVRVPIREAKVAMSAWASGHDMRRFMVGRYSVIKYEGDVIQIGCHRIPRENMTALYEVLMGKPFSVVAS